jgi:hypothetical protein
MKMNLYEDQSFLEKEVFYIPVNSDPWYYESKYYLTHGSTPHYMEPKNKRSLRLKSNQYHLARGILFMKNYDGVFLRCLEKDDAEKVLFKLHDSEETPLHTRSSGQVIIGLLIQGFTCICKKMSKNAKN